MVVWPHAAFSQRATCPPRAAVQVRKDKAGDGLIVAFGWERDAKLVCHFVGGHPTRQQP